MRYIILVKSTPRAERGDPPGESLIAAMARYHEELARAGALLDASGLHPTSEGWRIRYAGGDRTVLDGPFGEAKGVVAGYTLIQVRSAEEAREWARRFPNPAGEGREAEIEVRRVMELDELVPGPAVERSRTLDLPGLAPGEDR